MLLNDGEAQWIGETWQEKAGFDDVGGSFADIPFSKPIVKM